MKKLLLTLVAFASLNVFAAPPAPVATPAAPPAARPGPGRWDAMNPGEREEKMEDAERRVRMMAVVGISEALELNEGDALRLSEKIKAFEEKRKPVRMGMHESMKTLKAAAEGDTAAAAQVDAAMLKVLDGRSQMAAIDKEFFTTLSQGQTPQKKAKLALFLAKFSQELQRFRAMGGGEHGRH
jgi:hypothetical protein